MGIELSKKGWLVALRSSLKGKVSLHRLRAGDAQGPSGARRANPIGRRQRLASKVAVVSCYEAGYDGFWLHRVLTAAGVENYVVDPASIHVDRRARRAKTDRIDAQALLRTLMAHRRGEGRVWSVVRPPTPAEEGVCRPPGPTRAFVGGRQAHSDERLELERLHLLGAMRGPEVRPYWRLMPASGAGSWRR